MIKKHDIFIAFACLIAGFLLYLFLMPDKIVVVGEPRDSTVVKRDTIYKTSPPDTIVKSGAISYRTMVLHDTLYEYIGDTIKTLPFISCVGDTAEIGDTLDVCYKFPENQMSIIRKPQAQIIEVETHYIYKTRVNDLRTPWYETASYAFGSFLLGFGSGRIK